MAMILRAGYHQTTKRLVRAGVFGDNWPNPYNVCVTLGTDATWYGCDGVFGSVSPDATITDQTFYALKWKADGTFVMQFGVAGDEQVPDVPQIFMYHTSQTAPLTLVWDDTNSYYTSTDLTLATALIALQVGGETSICFNAEIEPIHFISYDFSMIRE